MSFDDLPDNWSDLPLDTPGLAADVADLVVGLVATCARRTGVLLGLGGTDPRPRRGPLGAVVPRGPSMRPGLTSRRESRFSTR